MAEAAAVARRLESIEQELRSLRAALKQSRQPAPKIVSLRGLMKGIRVTEKEIREAKRSLSPLVR